MLAVRLRDWARGGLRQPSLFGQKAVRVCAVALVTVVFGVHQVVKRPFDHRLTIV